MTVTIPLKAGEILTPKPPCWQSWQQVKLISSHQFKDRTFWWFEMTSKNGATHLDTLSEDNLRSGWMRKPSFFSLGKTYKFARSARADRYKVIELHQLDGAIDSGNSKAALCEVTLQGGKKMLSLLNGHDFGHMVEA